MAAASKELLPVYLLIGEDKLKRQTFEKKLQERIAALGDITLNSTVFQAEEVDPPDAVASACNTVPFLSEKRLVTVRHIDQAKKPLLDSLCAYLENPMESTVLLITGEKLNKTTALYKQVNKKYSKAFIACDVQKYAKFDKFIRDLATSKGFAIDEEAVEKLHDLVGNSTVTVNSELNKICIFLQSQGRTRITKRDIESMVSRVEELKPWDLTDPLMRRDAAKCMEVLPQMPSDSWTGLLVMCTRRIRELLVTKALMNRPGPMPDLNKVFGGNSPYPYRNHAQAARGFSEEELIRALDEAAECELRMKSGYDQETCLQLWVLGVCTSKWASA